MEEDLRFEEYFLFTQHSLATFEKCPLKFKKRYLEALKWNTFPEEEVKKRLEKGNDFHLLAHRYFMNIDTDLSEMCEDVESIDLWMKSLKENFILNENHKYLPEYKLRYVKGDLKLEANFDLIIVKDDAIEIWDWKTHEENNKNTKFKFKQYENTLQTKVYMFVLKELSDLVAGKEIKAENITMYYWQPSPPKIITQINYSNDLHIEFQNNLKEKLQNVLEYDYKIFEKEKYVKHCKMCEFNWFCNNERVSLDVTDEDFSVDDLDWDEVEERY